MLAVFSITLCFTIYNIVVFLGMQKRHKNWLITVFYIFSVIVLVMRIIEFIFLLQFYSDIAAVKDLWETP